MNLGYRLLLSLLSWDVVVGSILRICFHFCSWKWALIFCLTVCIPLEKWLLLYSRKCLHVLKCCHKLVLFCLFSTLYLFFENIFFTIVHNIQGLMPLKVAGYWVNWVIWNGEVGSEIYKNMGDNDWLILKRLRLVFKKISWVCFTNFQ